MVDAPCSGEGMFRKNSDACAEWSLENVELCADRQLEILNNAASMLKPGGQMAYSTCTFSYAENEGTIDNFLKEHNDFNIVHINKSSQMSDGFIPGTIRLWPHKLNGEGHFLTILQKVDNTDTDIADTTSNKHNKKYAPSRDFLQRIAKITLSFAINFLMLILLKL